VAEKECYGCGKVKPASEFHASKVEDDGLQNRCKDCQREYRARRKVEKNGKKPEDWKKKTADMVSYRKAYNENNREILRKLKKAWYEKRKKDVAKKEVVKDNPDALVD
jgi:hypothetical protein